MGPSAAPPALHPRTTLLPARPEVSKERGGATTFRIRTTLLPARPEVSKERGGATTPRPLSYLLPRTSYFDTPPAFYNRTNAPQRHHPPPRLRPRSPHPPPWLAHPPLRHRSPARDRRPPPPPPRPPPPPPPAPPPPPPPAAAPAAPGASTGAR